MTVETKEHAQGPSHWEDIMPLYNSPYPNEKGKAIAELHRKMAITEDWSRNPLLENDPEAYGEGLDLARKVALDLKEDRYLRLRGFALKILEDVLIETEGWDQYAGLYKKAAEAVSLLCEDSDKKIRNTAMNIYYIADEIEE